MGRKTTSITKGGKSINPTDQARKCARRRELKKNKQQKLAMRQAIIKTKDPQQMVKELEDLDDMELNLTSGFHFSEKVIKDKRRILLDTLIRIADDYGKEDLTRGRALKSMIESYRANKAKKEMYFESVKNAETVEMSSIPLPDVPFETPHLRDITLPGVKPQSILKNQLPLSGFPPTWTNEKRAPGPPPGFPPARKVFGKVQTSDFHHNSPEPLEGYYSDEVTANRNKKPSNRIAGEDAEMRDDNSALTPLQAVMVKLASRDMQDRYKEEGRQMEEESERGHLKPPDPSPGAPTGLLHRQGLPTNTRWLLDVVGRMPKRLDSESVMQSRVIQTILSAPPNLIRRPIERDPNESRASSNVGKPKLTTDGKSDVARFMPTSLRIQREVKGGKAASDSAFALSNNEQRIDKKNRRSADTSDAAYGCFMKEIQGLL